MQHLIRQFARQRLIRWLDRRQPAANPVTVQHSFAFVLPTRFGMSVLLLIVLLYILGTNYQNNLIMLLAYFLLVSWLSCIWLAFANLRGCRISCPANLDAVADADINIDCTITAKQQPNALLARWWHQATHWQHWQQPSIGLQLPPHPRGHYQLPRLAIASVHPLGLMRCWTYLQLDASLWVYPVPILAGPNHQHSIDHRSSTDEWVGIQHWQPGMSMRQINWKRFARDARLHTHQFSSQSTADEYWLQLNPQLGNFELQLSDLTARVLQAQQHNLKFGVRLPHKVLGPAQGNPFVTEVLRELALC